tara:strand:+ start:124 stop:720 length:597 start_codon:yes stop_codon:yes gene_type:complete
MNTKFLPISEIKLNDVNPRNIAVGKFEKLVQSIKDFPAMLEIRPIVIDEDNVILGGNMRFKACIEAGLAKVPTLKVNSLSKEEKQEFIIKDNVGFGTWDWEILTEEWDTALLDDWGLELGVNLDSEDFDEDFNLEDGDKSPFQQITFTLADEQAERVKAILADVKQTDGYKYTETFGNENSNGNLLYSLVNQWAEQRT